MIQKQHLVVIGNGMAGIACVEQILRHEHNFAITVFGDETHVNYNRIMLSSVLAGEKSYNDIVLNDIDWYRKHSIAARLGVKITGIDSKTNTVIDDVGVATTFNKLIIATGSSPFIPKIAGTDLHGVFVFRTIDDTRQMTELSSKGTKAVVIGGGLLGLEAARGLQVQGCDVTVVHLSDHLMERQLDSIGGSTLRKKIEALGIRVLCGKSTASINGRNRVESLTFTDGEEIPAEIVVIAAGIRPNVELGRIAGLQVNRGIVVNDHLETSHPDIYAVGECTEHKGQTFGLVAPLFDQG